MKNSNLNMEQMLLRIIAVASVLALIISIFALVTAGVVKKELKELSASISSNLQTISQGQSAIESKVAEISDAVNSTASAVTSGNASKYISIEKQPESVSTTLGRTQALVFEVRVKGNNLSYSWQRFDEPTGEWAAVPFDIDGFCDDYGLRLYNGYSEDIPGMPVTQIWANGITEKAFGRYRCIITDSAGSQITTEMAYIYEKEG